MQEKTKILWSPAGVTLASLDSRSLVSVSDGDTPNIRIPIRILSIDTLEVTAKSAKGAAKVNSQLNQLAQWIKNGLAPVSTDYANYLLPKLENTAASTLHESAWKGYSMRSSDTGRAVYRYCDVAVNSATLNC